MKHFFAAAQFKPFYFSTLLCRMGKQPGSEGRPAWTTGQHHEGRDIGGDGDGRITDLQQTSKQ